MKFAVYINDDLKLRFERSSYEAAMFCTDREVKDIYRQLAWTISETPEPELVQVKLFDEENNLLVYEYCFNSINVT